MRGKMIAETRRLAMRCHPATGRNPRLVKELSHLGTMLRRRGVYLPSEKSRVSGGGGKKAIESLIELRVCGMTPRGNAIRVIDRAGRQRRLCDDKNLKMTETGNIEVIKN